MLSNAHINNAMNQVGPFGSRDVRLPDAATLYQAIFEQCAFGVAQIETATGRFVRVNARYGDMVGYTREELEQMDFQTLTHPDDLAAGLENMRRLVAGEIREFSMEKRYRNRTGQQVWVKLTVTPLWRPGEPAQYHLAVVEDITERRQIEGLLRENEMRLRSVIEHAPFGAHSYELKPGDRLVLTHANPSAERILGIDHAALVGHTIEEAFPGLVETEIPAVYRRLAASEGCQELDQIVYHQGEIKGVYAIQAFHTGARQMTVFFRDITEQQKAKEALRRNEERYRTLFETMAQGVVYQDAAGRVIAANPAAERILGLTLDQMRGRTSEDARWQSIHEDGSAFLGDMHPAMVACRTGQPVQDVVMGVFNPIAKEYRWINVNAVPVFDSGNSTVLQVYATFDDITARKRAEQTLRASEDKFYKAFQTSPDAININRLADGVYLEINRGFTAITGYTADDVRGKTSLELGIWVNPEDRNRLMDGLHARGEVTDFEASFRMKGGRIGLGSMSARLIEVNGESCIISITRDITARKQAEAERERLISAIEQAAEIIIITDSEGTIQYVNPTFERVTGYTRAEAVGQNPRILKSGKHDAAFYQQFWATLKRGETWWGRLINRRKDGSLYTEEATISPVRDASGKTVNYVAAKRDISEQILLQDQLAQAQKMESVGRLAGGVAHDFNNMLQVILGNTALALQDLPAGSSLRECLEEVQRSAQRSAELTRQLLAFARKQTISPRILDLNDTVAGMLKMLRRLIGEDIDLAWMPGAGLWPVKLDPSQIDQILANLCVNARDAISGAGRVTLETFNVTLDDTYVQTHPECVPGDYVMLAVSDTGRGMDTEVLEHLFEPFFTTKERGKGTGLGLATVFGIVKQNSGFINVYSELNHGTTFKIYLHRAPSEAVSPPAEEARNLPRGCETVLLVEDEEQVLQLARRILEQHGYTVLTALAPEAALTAASRYRGIIHLLVTDVVMPRMNGKELLAQLRGLHPDIKCLYMSGYTANVIAHHGILDEGIDFLQKPFTMQTLTWKIRELCENARAAGQGPA
jgi:two-component system, cell cycle sensor histidine kinase and response regulator CckA